jgi:hypothetical protein
MEDQIRLPQPGQKTMILKGFEQAHLAGFVSLLIERYDLDLLYYITEFDTALPPEYADRIEVIPVNLLDKLPLLDWNRYEPIDAPLIDRMKGVESSVMAMFERSYAFHHSYIMRRRSYLQLLRLWYTIVQRGDFRGMVCDILPHAPTDHTAYGLCQELGLSKLFFDNFLPGFITVWRHWDEQPLGLAPLGGEGEPTEYIEEPLSERAELVLRSQTGEKGAATPYYMHDDFWKNYLKRTRKRLRWRLFNKPRTQAEKDRLLEPDYLYLQAERYFQSKVRQPLKQRALRRQLEKYSRSIDPTQIGRYLYVALHLQPEVSTGPRAGAYLDQQLIVEQLSACVPDDITLVVKENPKQTGLYRDRGIYRHLSRLRNVVLVPLEQNTFDLIANCEAVVTATGVVGWEALFRGKPAICFGYPFYRGARGVELVSSTEEVRTAIDKLVASEWDYPSLASARYFLQRLDRAAIYGNLDSHREHLLPSPPGLVDRLAAAVEEQLTA